jgi:hypothetical protein
LSLRLGRRSVLLHECIAVKDGSGLCRVCLDDDLTDRPDRLGGTSRVSPRKPDEFCGSDREGTQAYACKYDERASENGDENYCGAQTSEPGVERIARDCAEPSSGSCKLMGRCTETGSASGNGCKSGYRPECQSKAESDPDRFAFSGSADDE